MRADNPANVLVFVMFNANDNDDDDDDVEDAEDDDVEDADDEDVEDADDEDVEDADLAGHQCSNIGSKQGLGAFSLQWLQSHFVLVFILTSALSLSS